MGDGIRVSIEYRDSDRSIGIQIILPFDDYASRLFPNEHLREVINAAVDRVLAEQSLSRNRR